MKLLSFQAHGETRLGTLINEKVVDLERAHDRLFGREKSFPKDMVLLLEEGESVLKELKKLEDAFKKDLDLLSNPNFVFEIKNVKILAPVPRPRKNIICLGRNYVEHAKELASAIPEFPIIFTKPPTSIIGPDSTILLPKCSDLIDYEVELAFIFGKRGKNITEEEAYNYIAGYTIFNDVTARDVQRRHLQWFKGKGLDTFAPMGPYLVTKDEIPNPQKLELTLELNGKVMQRSNTENMIFNIPTLVKTISMDMTVEPGDIVATGTPSGVGHGRNPPVYMKEGDVVKAYVEKIGVLQSRVASN